MSPAPAAATLVEQTYVQARRRSIDPGLAAEERRAASGVAALVRRRGIGPERADQLDAQVLTGMQAEASHS